MMREWVMTVAAALLCVGALAACGDSGAASGSDKSPGLRDMSQDASMRSDSGVHLGEMKSGSDLGERLDLDAPSSDGGGGADLSGDQGAPVCGNGVVERTELCDGDCPQSCDDGDACTLDTRAGSEATCDVVCSSSSLGAACGVSDGCCPSGCTMASDEDCTALSELNCREPSSWPTAWVQRENDLIAEAAARRALGGSCGQSAHPATPALVVNAALTEAARCHSLDMARRGYFAGESPEGVGPLERAEAAGYSGATRIGQSISTRADVTMMVDNWLTREGNCEHLLNGRYDETGVGYVESPGESPGRFWTQLVADKP